MKASVNTFKSTNYTSETTFCVGAIRITYKKLFDVISYCRTNHVEQSNFELDQSIRENKKIKKW